MRSSAATAPTSSQQQKKKLILHIITTPYRALCKARDLYVRSVTHCGQPPAVSFASSSSSSKSKTSKQLLPRSFSSSAVAASSSYNNNGYSRRRTCSIGPRRQELEEEDYRELVRAASIRTLTDSGIIIEVVADMQLAAAAARPTIISRSVPRSASVGITLMGRIDEDRPLELVGADDEQVVGSGGQESSFWGKQCGRGGFRNNKSDLLYPRSKSYTVSKRNAAAF